MFQTHGTERPLLCTSFLIQRYSNLNSVSRNRSVNSAYKNKRESRLNLKFPGMAAFPLNKKVDHAARLGSKLCDTNRFLVKKRNKEIRSGSEVKPTEPLNLRAAMPIPGNHKIQPASQLEREHV